MTTLIGKDAALEDSLSRFKNIAKKLQIDLVEEQWLNPLEGIWSVHLSVASCPAIYSNGKGSTHDAALASAYGEIFERLATHMSFADFFLGEKNAQDKFVHFSDEKWSPLSPKGESQQPLPDDILTPELKKFYSENTDALGLEQLVDIQSCSFERGVCSIPFTNASNGKIVYFPVNLLDNLYASNGMSAGNTEYEALVQGLSEIIERYVKGRIIREGLTLPQIPDTILKKYPKSFSSFQGLQSKELKAICYDASLGGRFPVVCVVLFNQSNGTCVASFGAHPIFAVALDRTLTELMQGRTFSDLDNFEAPSFDLEQTSDTTNIESHFVDSTGLLPMQMFRKKPSFKFVSWDFNGSTHEQYKALMYIIHKLGFEIYVRTYQNLGLPVYRIVVPGMSEIYPVDDLQYNNTNAYIAYQEAIMWLPSSNEDPDTYADYLDELENEDLADEAKVAQILGLLPEEDSAWSSLRVGELKCLLAIEAENYEKALEYAKWTELFSQANLPLERLCFYRCLIHVLECRLDEELRETDYLEAYESLYGKEVVEHVLNHLNHKEKFFNLNDTDLNLKNFKQHQALIEVYNKIKNADIPLSFR